MPDPTTIRKALLRAYTSRICRSPETALSALVAMGFCKPEGGLTPEYGGDADVNAR